MNLQRLRKLAGLTILTEDHGDVRPVTMRIHEAMDEGIMSARDVADAALAYMSEFDVSDMASSNDWFYDEVDNEEGYDPNVDDYGDDDQEGPEMEEAIIEDTGRLYELIGYSTEAEYGYGGYTGQTSDSQEVVATFDSEEAAHEYAKKSMLRKVKRGGYKFHNKSLLGHWQNYEVEEKIDDIAPPHNPE